MHKTFCGPCFTTRIAPELEAYERTLERAKAVFVYSKGQGEETRLMKRTEKPLRVADCQDREEVLLRLAFLAAHAYYNALIEADIFSKRLRNAGYQTSVWQGTAIPTRVDTDRINRQEKRGKKLLHSGPLPTPHA